jgi:hypothetical protein
MPNTFVHSLIRLVHQAGNNTKTGQPLNQVVVGYKIVKPGVEAFLEKEMDVPLLIISFFEIYHRKHVLTPNNNPTQKEVGFEIAGVLTILAQPK